LTCSTTHRFPDRHEPRLHVGSLDDLDIDTENGAVDAQIVLETGRPPTPG
jgi:hypothetical protein